MFAAAALVALAIGAAGVQEAPPIREGRDPNQAFMLDCNDNGIEDSTDIATGVADDLDHDGAIDNCLHPVDVVRFLSGSLLRTDTPDPRAQHLLVAYHPRHALEVIYATRGDATLDGVTVLVRGGKGWRSVSHLEGPGLHRVLVPTADLGLANDTRGRGLVQLRLGRRTYSVPVAWDWAGIAVEPGRP